MPRRFLPLLIFVILSLGGCANRPLDYRAEFFDASQQGPYTLGTGDKLRIIVYGQDNLSNLYAVDGSGRISMPLIGAVTAKGLTTRALESQIEARLRNGYLRDPRVNVEVDQFRPFFILGEVTQSGQYPFVGGMTVQTAVAIAGGFTPRGAQSYAVVTRAINGEPMTSEVPITYPVRPGDTIAIKERLF
jgi:polysaccharide export outer membrane protein